MIVKWPQVAQPGSVCHHPVISTDFYPTILEIAGLPMMPEQHRDGVSLTPLLKQTGFPERNSLFWHYPHYSNQGGFPGGAIRVGDFKLIERFEDGRVHLYNLSEDVGEHNDLASQLPEQTASMRRELHAWYQQVGAKFLGPKPDGPRPWSP
jgi:arylsulfatase A-like enzyme